MMERFQFVVIVTKLLQGKRFFLALNPGIVQVALPKLKKYCFNFVTVHFRYFSSFLPEPETEKVPFGAIEPFIISGTVDTKW